MIELKTVPMPDTYKPPTVQTKLVGTQSKKYEYNPPDDVPGQKYIVCYSGGHSSAICAVEATRRYGSDRVILLNHNINQNVEDPDIKRFKEEVAAYLGIDITYANMDGVEVKDQFDICMELGAFKYGMQSSALCTRELKTKPFKRWLEETFPAQPPQIRDDVTILYGFDPKETARIVRRSDVMTKLGYKTDFPLLWANRTIHNIEEIGINRPKTYEIYRHANCIGCLKSGKQHWFCVYCLRKDIWEKAKHAEEVIGYSILRKQYLKELEPEFERLKQMKIQSTEKISPQKFWAIVQKAISDYEA